MASFQLLLSDGSSTPQAQSHPPPLSGLPSSDAILLYLSLTDPPVTPRGHHLLPSLRTTSTSLCVTCALPALSLYPSVHAHQLPPTSANQP